MSTGRRRRYSGALLLSLGLASCSDGPFGVTCSTIGCSSTLTVEVIGDPESVGELRLCDQRFCSLEPGETRAYGDSSRPGWGGPTGDGESWTFTVFYGDLSVEIEDHQGSVMKRVAIDPEWVRVGGTEACGGPMEATVQVEV
ncbi:hypothetical protein [Serinibacter salmoneus]|uniref:Uncharacterized protein n=1 Tax=Serinibacter salmoneus TaxID=556530 RepID=A0A2A9D0E4_9MICO|nr:hypothetical protein [Serinibacter salmoneus]PFG20157.1 hypothetical protein ATL40_1744 [Serinibacter salmoneus]